MFETYSLFDSWIAWSSAAGYTHFFCLFLYICFAHVLFSHGQVLVSTERGAEKEDRADASGESKF